MSLPNTIVKSAGTSGVFSCDLQLNFRSLRFQAGRNRFRLFRTSGGAGSWSIDCEPPGKELGIPQNFFRRPTVVLRSEFINRHDTRAFRNFRTRPGSPHSGTPCVRRSDSCPRSRLRSSLGSKARTRQRILRPIPCIHFRIGAGIFAATDHRSLLLCSIDFAATGVSRLPNASAGHRTRLAYSRVTRNIFSHSAGDVLILAPN